MSDQPPNPDRTKPAAPPTQRTPALPISAIDIDQAGRIAQDVPCRACGYNLVGLAPSGDCPECATAIERSIRGELLQFSDPGWVKRLTTGVLWIIIGSLSGIVVGILIAFGIAMLTNTGAPTIATALVSCIGVVPALMILFGAWVLTTPDPGQTGQTRPVTARTLTRWCLLAQLAATPLELFGGTGFNALGNPVTAISLTDSMIIMAAVAAGVVSLVGRVAGLWYLGQLALRLPNPGLAKQCRIVAAGHLAIGLLGAVVTVVAIVVLPGVMAAGPPAGVPGSMLLLAGGGCVMGLGGLVVGVWALVLLFILHHRFGTAAAAARERWNS
ncbi:MAG: hypothetical protein GY716_09100 [bacterium]|nr:hypothetical protein [bacterium]